MAEDDHTVGVDLNKMFEVAISQLESDQEWALEQMQGDALQVRGATSAESLLAILRAGVEIGRIVNASSSVPQVVSYRRLINAIWGSVNSPLLINYVGAALLTVLSFTYAEPRGRRQTESQTRRERSDLVGIAREHILGDPSKRGGLLTAADEISRIFRWLSDYDPIIHAARYRNVWDYVEEIQTFDFSQDDLYSNVIEEGMYESFLIVLEDEFTSDLSRSSSDNRREGAIAAIEELCHSSEEEDTPFSSWVSNNRVMHHSGYSDRNLLADDTAFAPMELVNAEQISVHEYRVWYGTDREPDRRGPEYGFQNKRDTLERLHVGACTVHIPESHIPGSLGHQWLSRWPLVSGGALRLHEITPLPDIGFFVESLSDALGPIPCDQRIVVIYVHGYNSTFKRSAIRAAQLGFDLGISGEMAFFSWPSRGRALAYPADEASVATSENRFARFVEAIAKRTGATQVNLIVHSMGNRLTARAMEVVRHTGVKLGKIILAAPDIDAQLFRSLAEVYPAMSEKTTMYVSPKDNAVRMSRFLHGYHRAGLTPPITVVPNIDTIDVGDVDLSQIGHGYFASTEPVLSDIKAIFDGLINPESRLGLASLTSAGGGTHWVLRRI